jgi:hypothetical protein
MPRKSKKKAGKKSTQKTAVKKTAKKKAMKKAAPRKAKNKAAAKAVRSGTVAPKTAGTTESVPLCAKRISLKNGDCILFTGIPTGGATISQLRGQIYPFQPVTGYNNGLAYTNLPLPLGECLRVVVPAIGRIHCYDVSACPGPCCLVTG